MSEWTDEKVEALIKLWNQPGRALSYGEMGDILGFNRNAIAGKCDRLKLKRGRATVVAAKGSTAGRADARAKVASKSAKPGAEHPWVQGNERAHKLAKAKSAAAGLENAGAPSGDTALPVAVAERTKEPVIEVKVEQAPQAAPRAAEEILFGDVAPAAQAPSLPVPFGAKECELDGKPMRGLDLMDLNDRTCHWPVGDPLREDFFFCGRTIGSGQVYCRFHLSVRTSKSAPRTRRPAPSSVRALPQQVYA